MGTIINPLITDTDLHFEHELWTREIAFWKDELMLFDARMDELSERSTSQDVLDELEDFRKNFDEHKELMKRLTRFIITHEKDLALHRKKGDHVLERGLVQQHLNYSDIMYGSRRDYGKLRKKFLHFLAKCM